MIPGPVAKPSLRSRLVRQVVLPLVLTWALGTAIALGLAHYFAGQAYDRALLDDAYVVAAHVRTDAQGQLGFSMSPREMGVLLFDQSESVYFAVLHLDGSLLTGHGGLHPPALPENGGHGYGYGHLHGRDLRTVGLRRSQQDAFVVVTAQTTTSRDRLMNRLLAYSLLPQLLLLVLLAIWLRRVIGLDLRPLVQLQVAVDRRGARDLEPLPEAMTTQAPSRELERLGGAINALLARLAQSLTAQREFAGNVAHELRTPLAGLRAQAEYALAHDNPQVWQAQLKGILRSEARASHQIEQLLALARVDEGRTGLQLRTVALDSLVRETLLRHLARADAAGVDLGAQGLDTPTEVWADPALVEGMLDNLIDNALRYGQAEQPRVTVELARESDRVSLTVTDNGPGLNANERQLLTRRGSQGAAGLALGRGAGLGLAIVGRYAELLGADFRLMAAPQGPGLRASLTFPPSPA